MAIVELLGVLTPHNPLRINVQQPALNAHCHKKIDKYVREKGQYAVSSTHNDGTWRAGVDEHETATEIWVLFMFPALWSMLVLT